MQTGGKIIPTGRFNSHPSNHPHQKEWIMQQRSEQTRKHIVDSALALFSQKGYATTSVAQICDRAQVSKGAFYHHFETKQALFLELLQTWLSRIDKTLDQSRWEMSDVPSGLMRMANAMRWVLREADENLPMFLEFWSQARLDPVIWKATIDPYRRYQNYFTSMIEEGVGEGSMRQVDPQLGAWVIVCFSVGLLLQCVLDPKGEDWGEVASQGMQVLLDGFARRNS
jgi:AcrR family transcriptional regulator